MEINNSIEIALKNFLSSMEELRKLDVLTNKKDFTCQIGEWLVAMLYDGVRSTNGIQKDWDIKIGEKRIQVKAHSKAPTTGNKTSAIKHNVDAEIDELIIVVFSNNYKLISFFKLSWKEALEKIKKEKHKDVIYWNHLKEYEVDLTKLEKQHIIKLFK